MESLEDRRLLAAVLSVDSDSFSNTSLLVQYRGDATPRQQLLGATLGSQWAVAPGLREVSLAPGTDVAKAIRAYQSDPNVLFVEPDYRVSLLMEPEDPDYFHQWDLHNAGTSGGVEDADIDAPEAWDVTTGSRDVIVAVIDTGVDYNHPDLAANIWTNEGEIPGNKKDDDHNGYVDDVHGYDFANNDGDPMDDHFHGTHVAGTIGAVGANQIGIAGVAWQVQIMALKFLDGSGSGYASDAIDALNYAVANGATVSNNSWGGGGFSQAMQTAIQNAASKGHIYVAAAGNDGSNNDSFPFYPANYKVANVVSVAASTIEDQFAYFSNFGKTTVDLAAPGQDIYSTMPVKATPAMKSGGYLAGYDTLSGTSMAAPHVTGVVALVRSLHPEWTYKQVIDQILITVDVVEGLEDTITGGRLNAAGAVGNAPPPPPDTRAPKVVSSNPSGAVTGPVSTVHVKFSESIDVATFNMDDVISFEGPGGLIGITSLSVVEGSGDREFEIAFSELVDKGDYSLVIGPAIADLSGNLLDQNGDGLGGDDAGDRYTVAFTIGSSVTPPSADVPLPIGDVYGVPVFSRLFFDQDVTISDINVQLNISFPYDGDLHIALISPSGTTVTLSAFNGGIDADFADTTFDDEASESIFNGFAPYAGSYQPDGSGGYLSAFDGESAKGEWMLAITIYPFSLELDGYGWLNAWSLQIEGDGISPPPDDPPDDPGDPPPPPPEENHAPIAVNDHFSIVVNEVLSLKFADLLRNDVDPDGDRLYVAFFGNDVHGKVEFDSDTTSIVFTPDFGFSGEASFQYIVHDGELSAIGTVTIDVEASFQGHNALNGLDVNNDGEVSPLDALLIINFLNAPKQATPDSGVLAFGAYYDVVADNIVAPLDALTIINFLNATPTQPAASLSIAEVGSDAGNGATLLADESGPAGTSKPAAAESDACSQSSETVADATAPRRRLRAAVDHLMASDALQELLEDLDLSCASGL